MHRHVNGRLLQALRQGPVRCRWAFAFVYAVLSYQIGSPQVEGCAL